jgi:aspartyl aminopeptidase
METRLEHTQKSCWETYASEQERQEIEEIAQRYLEFLSACKTERETMEWIRAAAGKAGFGEDLSGPAYIRTAKEKIALLARKGRRPLSEGIRIIGSHADTPRLDFKQHPLYESCDLALAKTHYYGGIRKHQWFSRPLALHGVIVKTDGRRIPVNIGESDSDPVFVIADLLPHLAQHQNEKTLAKAFDAEKMNLLLGGSPARDEDAGSEGEGDGKKVKKRILQILYDRYHVVEEDLFSAELQAVPAGPARRVGLDGSLIGGYGQDDRICVFGSLEAMLAENDPEYTQVAIFWDKEEIGSEGATSARSLFFEYGLQDIVAAWEPEASLASVMANAKAVSADVHGGVDPDNQDLHDLLNASKLGYGPVLCKFTGHRGKIGANDAHAEYVAWLRGLLNGAGIPWQMAEIGKVDQGGGGTVAKHLAVYGLDIIDMGPSVLAMHSPFEVSSTADLYATFLAFRQFLRGSR